MGGIINYYHGESGLVADRQYIVTNEQQVHALRLRDDPHREFAYDYGTDIGIDPLLKTGDQAVFVRADQYSGLWVREKDQFYPELQQAYDRVTEERARDLEPGVVRVRLANIWAEQYIAEDTQSQTGNPFPDRPATEVSFFLSFSSKNVLLARQIFEDLKYDAKVEVWFDIDQEGEAPEHGRRIETWLREAVYRNRGFILLWTKAASESRWVRKEISWALEKASYDPEFRFVVLKLDDEPVPDDLLDPQHVVDCNDLWPINGITEELFATITDRQGRGAWIEEHQQRGIEIEKDQGSYGYEPFRSDSGIAISLRHWEEDGEFCWQLDYEKDRRLHRAFGRGEEQAVDLEIRTGDYVGFFVLHRAPLVRFWPGKALWMRSRDLSIEPGNVWITYKQRSEATGAGGDKQ